MSGRLEHLRPHLVPLLFLLLASVACYGRILGHDFIFNWDDSFYVIDNEAVHGFSLDHIRTVFSSFYVGNYSPLQMLSYMLDYTLWGLRPGGYLFSNLLLHTLNGLLVYRLLLRLHGERLVATLGAAIFLLHPVQVESVAWVSQRKNLLAMLFFLLAWGEYIRYCRAEAGQAWRAYLRSVILFVLALLSKSMVIILPLFLLLFDRCYPAPGRRYRYLDKLPYLLVAAAVALLSLNSQMPDERVWGGGGGRLAAYHGGSALATFLTMLPVACRYLGLLLLPSGLSAEYDPVIYQTLTPTVVGAALLLVVVGLLTVRLVRLNPKLGFWSLYFWIGLLPVSQVIPLVTLMNDRYLYLPLVGGAALAAAGMSRLYRKWAGPGSGAGYLLLAVPLLLLAVASYQRTTVWADPVSLWSDTVKKVPGRASAWEKLGEAYHGANPPLRREAVKAYQTALTLAPSSEITLYNLGVLNTELGEYEEAAASLKRLLTGNPLHVMGMAALGVVCQRQGKLADAELLFRRALELQPDALQVVRLLADLAYQRQHLDQAREYYLQLEGKGWGDATTAYRLAGSEARQGHREVALDWLSKALERGFREYPELVGNRDFSGLRGDPRFQALLRRYPPNRRD